MTKHGKIYQDSIKMEDPEQVYSLAEAMDIIKSFPPRKFDQTVDGVFRLGVDPRKAEQMVRGTVALPHGTGRSVRVAVFAEGDAARAAQEAGADVVGGQDLVTRVEGGFLDFDIAISTPELMAQVGKLGRALGPRGLMPNPKTGTVTPDVGKAVSDFKAGKVEYRTDRNGNVHVSIGKLSFSAEKLADNFRSVLDELLRVKPASLKGRYLTSVSVSAAMSPGVRIDPSAVEVGAN
ncbi:MAG: 50S ribosomal protein L1 [Actinobacteria bacterium]|jgi:large subunit ribosomal protein L1|nr:50S ribosomal protein L1 [Acidimicrobiia bacterium]PHX59635.1 MAG: 50S ribosomal protein L1 [Actinomycetota bacterium]